MSNAAGETNEGDVYETPSRTGGKNIKMNQPMMRRRTFTYKDNIYGIRNPCIRKLARKAGVKRISLSVYDNIRLFYTNFLTKVLRDAIIRTEHSRRRTVFTRDIVASLQGVGISLYGCQ